MRVKNYFPSNLKCLIKENDLRQYEFADEMMVKQGTVSSWVCGRTEPNFETLIEISYFFGVSVDDLLKKDMKGMEE